MTEPQPNDEICKEKPDICLTELDKRRELKGPLLLITGTVAVAASLFHLAIASGEWQLFALTHRAVHLAFIGFLGFLYYPAFARKKDRVPLYDIGLALLVVGLCAYLIMSIDQLVYRAGEPALLDLGFRDCHHPAGPRVDQAGGGQRPGHHCRHFFALRLPGAVHARDSHPQGLFPGADLLLPLHDGH